MRRKRADWMTAMDDKILEVLKYDLILSPSIVAVNIDTSYSGTHRRLSELVDHQLVEKVDRGHYRITDIGQAYLAGKLDADGLEAAN